jgi:hypothetical protein
MTKFHLDLTDDQLVQLVDAVVSGKLNGLGVFVITGGGLSIRYGQDQQPEIALDYQLLTPAMRKALREPESLAPQQTSDQSSAIKEPKTATEGNAGEPPGESAVVEHPQSK